jgi:hypothetical protein
VGHDAYVIFGKILSDYGAPAIGAKFYLRHGSEV